MTPVTMEPSTCCVRVDWSRTETQQLWLLISLDGPVDNAWSEAFDLHVAVERPRLPFSHAQAVNFDDQWMIIVDDPALELEPEVFAGIVEDFILEVNDVASRLDQFKATVALAENLRMLAPNDAF